MMRTRAMITIGDVSKRTGLSVRTLHHWEAMGLITPARSEAGQRHYGPADVIRLTQIKQLKAAGLELKAISALMTGDSDPAQVLEAQHALLTDQKTEITTAIEGLEAALSAIKSGDAPSLAHLCNALKWGRETMSEEKWQAVYDAYYSPDEQARFAEAKLNWVANKGADSIKKVEAQWADLIARVEALITDKIPPTDSQAAALAGEWRALAADIWAADPALAEGAERMYQDMENWDAKTGGQAPEPPFSADVWAYIEKAANAAS